MTLVKVLLVCLCWTALLADPTAGQRQPQCGVPKPKANQLIVRGRYASPQDWPWHALIIHKRPAPEYACGGTLIHSSYVVTAKHCVKNKGTGYLLSTGAVLVQVGVEELYDTGPHFQQHRVLSIHIVRDQASAHLNNDIAIVELRTSVEFNDYVLPACLLERRMAPGEMGTVIGFGLTEDGDVSPMLKQATMPVIETGKCLRADRTGFGALLDEGLFCAGYLNGTTVCNGDSGGGFFVKAGNVWQLAGLVSFGLGGDSASSRCRQDSYGAFTMVWKYLDWIRETAGLQASQSVSQYEAPSEVSVLPRNCGLNTKADHPWLAVLYAYYNYEYWYALGSGSIISERYVLDSGDESLIPYGYSAFRFVVGRDTNRYLVNRTDWRGTPYVNAIQPKSLIVKSPSKDIVLHLFRLQEKLSFNDFVQPICLPTTAELRVTVPDQFTFWYSLWDERGDNPMEYQFPESRTSSSVDSSRCLAVFGKFVTDRGVCADDPYCTVPVSDVTFRHNGRHVLRGFRHHPNCAVKLMVIRKVELHLDWLLKNMSP